MSMDVMTVIGSIASKVVSERFRKEIDKLLLKKPLLIRLPTPYGYLTSYFYSAGLSYYFGRPSESNFLRYFRPQSGWVVAVVGAFVGYYVLIASKMVGSKGKVLAFEPEPRNFAILLKNIRDNKLIDVVIPLRLALSDKDGYELLTLSSQPPMHSTVSIPNLSYAYKDSKIIVKARRLDTLLEELHLRRVDLLKIDVEELN